MNVVVLFVGALLLFPWFTIVHGFCPMMGGMWGGHMWGDGTVAAWMVLIGLLMQLLFLAAIVGAGYLIYRAMAASKSGTNQALEELRLAYARGDLTNEEYGQRKEALERDS